MARKVKVPKHGFPAEEFTQRHERARKAMDAAGLDALVVTTPQNIRYFTGFETQFWESPTRPWYLIVPRQGERIAVFPSIGKPALLATTSVRDIRTWSSPDLKDDGVSLMAATLLDLKRKHGKIGWEFGREMLVRAPRIDVDRMAKKARGLQFTDGSPTIWALRQVKSAAEIDRIRVACTIASDAYDEVPSMTSAGDTTRQAELALRTMLMQKGADRSITERHLTASAITSRMCDSGRSFSCLLAWQPKSHPSRRRRRSRPCGSASDGWRPRRP